MHKLLPEPPPCPPILGGSEVKVPQNWESKALWQQKILIRCLGVAWLSLGWFLGMARPSGATASVTGGTEIPTMLQARSSCPNDVDNLTTLLVRDLPAYANRTSQRAFNSERSVNPLSYVIVAGKPEIASLTLGPGPYLPIGSPPDPSLRQMFITTLRRSYTADRAIELQEYHWLFLTQAQDGWRMAMMFSQIGSYPAGQPPSPPRESTEGSIGQAVSLWLRDCRAGRIR